MTLAGAQPGVPSIAPGRQPGRVTSRSTPFGIAPIAIGDEDLLNFNVPAYLFNGVTYTVIGVDSNGYLVVGGGTSEDNNCCDLPDRTDRRRRRTTSSRRSGRTSTGPGAPRASSPRS